MRAFLAVFLFGILVGLIVSDFCDGVREYRLQAKYWQNKAEGLADELGELKSILTKED